MYRGRGRLMMSSPDHPWQSQALAGWLAVSPALIAGACARGSLGPFALFRCRMRVAYVVWGCVEVGEWRVHGVAHPPGRLRLVAMHAVLCLCVRARRGVWLRSFLYARAPTANTEEGWRCRPQMLCILCPT